MKRTALSGIIISLIFFGTSPHAAPVIVSPGGNAGYMYFSAELESSSGSGGGGVAVDARTISVEKCYDVVGTHTVDIAQLLKANPAEGRGTDYTKAMIEVIAVGGGGGSGTTTNGLNGAPSKFVYKTASIVGNGGFGSLTAENSWGGQKNGGSGSPRGNQSSGAPGGGGGYGGYGGPASPGINGSTADPSISGGTRGGLGQGSGYSKDLKYASGAIGAEIKRPPIINCPGMSTIKAASCAGGSWLTGAGGSGYGAGAGGCTVSYGCGWNTCYKNGTGGASGYITIGRVIYDGGNATITVGDGGGPVKGARGVVAIRVLPYE